MTAVKDLAADQKESGVGPCGHSHRRLLGARGDAQYLRCGCGSLIIAQGGRTWILRPQPS